MYFRKIRRFKGKFFRNVEYLNPSPGCGGIPAAAGYSGKRVTLFGRCENPVAPKKSHFKK